MVWESYPVLFPFFQLPLETDGPVDAHLVTNTILPEKDVDGWVTFAILL